MYSEGIGNGQGDVSLEKAQGLLMYDYMHHVNVMIANDLWEAHKAYGETLADGLQHRALIRHELVAMSLEHITRQIRSAKEPEYSAFLELRKEVTKHPWNLGDHKVT